MPASLVTTSLLPSCRAAASTARSLRSRLHRPSPRRAGMRCLAATTPPGFPGGSPEEVPDTNRPPEEVPGTNRPPLEVPSIDTPPEFGAPPGVDVPMPGPDLPGPAIPSPPTPEVPTVPPNPDVPPPQPPEVDPPRPPPEVEPPGAAPVPPPFV